MNNETLAIILMAVPPTLLALAVFLPTALTVLTAALSYRNGKKSDAIHVLANSTLTKLQADLAAANERIHELQELVAKIADRRQAVNAKPS